MDRMSRQDVTDDRLAEIVRVLPYNAAFEQELMGQRLRVSDVPAACVRIDTTIASNSADVDEQRFLQRGHEL